GEAALGARSLEHVEDRVDLAALDVVPERVDRLQGSAQRRVRRHVVHGPRDVEAHAPVREVVDHVVEEPRVSPVDRVAVGTRKGILMMFVPGLRSIGYRYVVRVTSLGSLAAPAVAGTARTDARTRARRVRRRMKKWRRLPRRPRHCTTVLAAPLRIGALRL